MRVSLVATLLALLVPLLLRGADESVLIDGVAAYVNQHIVTIGETLTVMDQERRQLEQRYAGRELKDRLKNAYSNALDALIEKQLVVDAYEKQEMKLPEWVVEARIDEIVQDMFKGDRAALMEALAKDSLTYDEWRQTVQEQMAATSMRNAHVDAVVSVSPGEVRRYYEQHPDQFKSVSKVKLRMLVLDRKKADGGPGLRRYAESLLKRVRDGEDFSALATKFSTGDKAQAGGDWGWVETAMLRPELVAALNALKPGETSGIIETEEQFYLLKLEGRQAEGTQAFADVQKDIERELRAEAVAKAYADWLARLKAESYVKIRDVGVF